MVRRGRAITGANRRPLKSLADPMIKGRRRSLPNRILFGKRVDYSGRSVIVGSGPDALKSTSMWSSPKDGLLELFKPLYFSKLQRRGLATTIKAS